MKPVCVCERKILLRGFEIQCQIGIHDFELGKPQRVIIDIDLVLDAGLSHRGDDIATVVDYDYLRDEIKEMVRDKTYNLQETLCEDIVNICMSKDEVASAVVRTSKPDVYDDCDQVSYQMTAKRADDDG